MSNNKKIIGIIGVVFVALVGYKFISSNIQEKKEKTVLQEKYRLEQLQKNQERLEKKDEEQQKQSDIESCIEEARTRLRTSTGSKCFNEVGDEAILSCGKKEANEKCEKYKENIDLSIVCLKEEIKYANKINDDFERNKNECYKRY